MMLETTSTPAVREPGGPHFGSPDKDPAVRLRVLEDAGRSAVPFTTGVLVGHRRDYAERVDAICEIRGVGRSGTGTCRRSSSRTSGPSPDTAMRHTTTSSSRSTSPPSR